MLHESGTDNFPCILQYVHRFKLKTKENIITHLCNK